MFEAFWSKIPWSNFYNVLILLVIAYVFIRHIVPLLLSKNQDESYKNFDSLVRQKKIELTTTPLEDPSELMPPKAPGVFQNEVLKIVSEKFNSHLPFYTDLIAKISWNQEILSEIFKKTYPDLPVFSFQMNDLKKALTQTDFAHLHRGEFHKIILLMWFERFFDCLWFDRPLPELPKSASLSSDLNLWRWALLSFCCDDKKWQTAVFENQETFSQYKKQVFTSKNITPVLMNNNAWWQRLCNRVYQLEPFVLLTESEIIDLKNKELSKKERLLLLKKYHPDSAAWDIIATEYRPHYEELLNHNFSLLADF